MSSPPLSYHFPHVSILAYGDLPARVVIDFLKGEITVYQPQRYGGKDVFTMNEYNDFEGNLESFIVHRREMRRG